MGYYELGVDINFGTESWPIWS